MKYATTVSKVQLNDDDKDFPYFSAVVSINEDPEAMPDKPAFWGVDVHIFIDRSDSMSVGDLKERAIQSAHKFLKDLSSAI